MCVFIMLSHVDENSPKSQVAPGHADPEFADPARSLLATSPTSSSCGKVNRVDFEADEKLMWITCTPSRSHYERRLFDDVVTRR